MQIQNVIAILPTNFWPRQQTLDGDSRCHHGRLTTDYEGPQHRRIG